MKKSVLNQSFLLAFILFMGFTMTSSCILADGIEGNGNVVTEERNVSGFDGISVGGAFDVYLTQGNSEELKIEAESNLMEYIKTKVLGGTLIIETDENLKPTKSMKLHITFKDLDEIEASGACDLESVNMLNLDELELDFSGATDVELELSLNKIEADFSGASDVELSGSAGEIVMDISGAGELDALELEVEKVRLDVSGAATAKVYAKTYLKVDVSGAATVKYKGNPQVDSDVSGAGSVKPY